MTPRNDPFETLRLLSQLRNRGIPTTIAAWVLITYPLSAIVLAEMQPGTHPLITFMAATAGPALFAVAYYSEIAWRRHREARKIRANRYQGNRLYIQQRCQELVDRTGEFHGQTLNMTHELHITMIPHRIGTGYHIQCIEYELHAIDPDTLENQYAYTTYTYMINPHICQMDGSWSVEICKGEQAAGYGTIIEQKDWIMEWLEDVDITFLNEALYRMFEPARSRSPEET